VHSCSGRRRRGRRRRRGGACGRVASASIACRLNSCLLLCCTHNIFWLTVSSLRLFRLCNYRFLYRLVLESTVQCRCGPLSRKFLLTKLLSNSPSHTTTVFCQGAPCRNPTAKPAPSWPRSAGLKPSGLSRRVVFTVFSQIPRFKPLHCKTTVFLKFQST
jgi:hypothetical protein